MSENTWNVRKLEEGLLVNRGELFRFGTAILFIVLIMLFALVPGPGGSGGTLLVMAAKIGGYMALNSGANHEANTVGPAVSSHAITLTGAIIRARHQGTEGETVDAFLERLEAASVEEKGEMLRALKSGGTAGALDRSERKGLRKIKRVDLVKRKLLLRIAAAWVITVPAAALLSAMIFFMIRGALLP